MAVMKTVPTIRPAQAADLPELARMGTLLMRLHHGMDAQRFMLPADAERGYAWWFDQELRNAQAHLAVAEWDGSVRGYAYTVLEPRDWNALREPCAALHDLWVDEPARRSGAARALLEHVFAWCRERGSPRVVLHTAFANTRAQALFASVGFRTTMLEMTAELPPAEAPPGR